MTLKIKNTSNDIFHFSVSGGIIEVSVCVLFQRESFFHDSNAHFDILFSDIRVVKAVLKSELDTFLHISEVIFSCKLVILPDVFIFIIENRIKDLVFL